MLYSMEEICKDCTLAVFHDCCNKFCRCKEKHEEETSAVDKSCPYRVIEKSGEEWTDVQGRKIEPAPQVAIEQYEGIARRFFSAILGMEYYDCFITDMSDLTDFIEDEEYYIDKVMKEYNIDISDIEGLSLVKIFERIRILEV